jgi:hypothetical protein
MTSVFKFYKTSFLPITYMFFKNRINFGNLGNFMTVGDTFNSKLIFKIKNKYEKQYGQFEKWHLTFSSMYVIPTEKKFLDFRCVDGLLTHSILCCYVN